MNNLKNFNIFIFIYNIYNTKNIYYKEDLFYFWEKNMNLDKYLSLSKKVREEILKMIFLAKSGHPGGSLSTVDIMIALYFKYLRFNAVDFFENDRDRFILSKGHVCPSQYACLALSGLIPMDELKTLRKIGSKLQGHPSYKAKLKGIEVSTGSLGQGLSIGSGMALGLKLDKKDNNIYVLLGDGELQSGQIWEAIMTSSHYKLNNLCAIIDYNNLQIDGKVSDIKSIMPIKNKFDSFNWNTIEIDGHNYAEIFSAFDRFNLKDTDRPTAIIAKTVKGKGVSFMENNPSWHGKAPNREELDLALKELENFKL